MFESGRAMHLIAGVQCAGGGGERVCQGGRGEELKGRTAGHLPSCYCGISCVAYVRMG